MLTSEFTSKFRKILASTFQDLSKICTQPFDPILQGQIQNNQKLPSNFQHQKKNQIGQQPKKEVKKRRRRRKLVTEGKPKPPPNSFVLFLKQKKQEIQRKHEGISIAGTTSIASKNWKQMSFEEKGPYLSLYYEKKKGYEKQLKQFNMKYPELRNKNKSRSIKNQKIDNFQFPLKKQIISKRRTRIRRKKVIKKQKESEKQEMMELINSLLSQDENNLQQ